MTEIIKEGRKKTILISISILLISIHTIYYHHAIRPEIETNKLLQQISRFLLTLVLLFYIYKGKSWATILAVILFSFAILGAIIGLTHHEGALVHKSPLIVMIFIYSIAVYHIGFSKSYKAFFEYLNEEK